MRARKLVDVHEWARSNGMLITGSYVHKDVDGECWQIALHKKHLMDVWVTIGVGATQAEAEDDFLRRIGPIEDCCVLMFSVDPWTGEAR